MKRLDINKINSYIVLISSHNESALKKLFKYTYSNMYTIAEYYLFNKNNIEDILSQLYINVYEHAHSFDKTRNGYNWMYTILKNLAINENKRESFLFYTNDFVDKNSYDSLKKILVVEDLEVLNDKEKRFIYMLYWEGYTIEEISKLDNVSINTLYSLRKRIYKKLRDNHRL